MAKQPYTKQQLEELILLQLQQMDIQRKAIIILKEQNELLIRYNKALEETAGLVEGGKK